MLETRTVYDELYGKGKNIGDNEFFTDHYRRFIEPKDFLSFVLKDYFIHYYELSTGFAPLQNEDPLIMRLVFGPTISKLQNK